MNPKNLLIIWASVFTTMVSFEMGYYVRSNQLPRSKGYENSFKYIDWVEEIRAVSKDPCNPTIVNVYQHGDTLYQEFPLIEQK